MTQDHIKEIIRRHGLWLRGEEGGKRANLRGADLSGADLRWANLTKADLSGTNLSWANLSRTNLSWANLSGTKLSGANLRWAQLSWANLSWVDLTEADLSGMDLSGANLRGADLRWAMGNMREIKSMQVDTWQVVWTADQMAIGCEQHPITDWWNFKDDEIDKMDPNALGWWRKWKPILRQIIEGDAA